MPAAAQADVWKGNDGQPQTIYVRQAVSREVTERLYDKGVESGSHAPGRRLRYEAQRWPARASRFAPEVLASLDLSGEYGRSIKTYVKGGENVIAAGPKATVQQLAGKVARGDLSMAKAERLVGSVELLREYGRAVYADERTARRRVQWLREAGISLEDELPSDRVVPVGQLQRDSMESFRA